MPTAEDAVTAEGEPRASGLELAVISIVFFGPLAFGCVEPWSIAMLEIALFLTAVHCCRLRLPRPNSAVYSTVLPSVLGLILLGMLQRQNPAAIDGPRRLLPFTASAYDTTRTLVLWCSYAALLWSAPQALRGAASLRRLAWAIFGVGTAVAMIGIAQISHNPRLIYGFRPVSVYRYYEAFGPYYNRDHAASLMGMSALAGTGIFFSRLSAERRRSGIEDPVDFFSTQGLILLAILIVALAVIESGSRAGWGLLLFCFCLGMLASTHDLADAGSKWALRLAAAAVACGGLAAFIGFQTKLAARLKGVGAPDVAPSIAGRLYMYRIGGDILADSPFFGWGAGTFARVFPRYQDPALFRNQRLEHVHSECLELLLQAGIAGFAVLAAGLLRLARRTIGSWKTCPPCEMRHLAGWLLCAAFYFALHGLVDFSFEIPANAVIFILILCWLGAPWAGTPEPRTPAEDPAKPASIVSRKAGAALALGCLAMAAAAVMPAVGYWRLRSASQSPSSLRRPRLEAAIAWDPNPETLYQAGATYLAAAEAFPAAETEAPSPRRAWLSEALKRAEDALRADPSNARFRYLQGAVLWRLGRENDARLFLDDGR